MTALPSYIDAELWSAFVSQRNAMKSIPFTAQAQKLVIMKLMRFHGEGYDANAILEKSAIYGYRSVFADEKLKIVTRSAEDPELARLKAHKGSPPSPETLAKMAELRKGVM